MKRKYIMPIHNNNKRRKNYPLKLQTLPVINIIHDLIELGNSDRLYKNIDTDMLRKITPYLEKLDKMIGMKSLKDSVLCQVMYYLKGFNIKNEEYLHTMIMGLPGTGKTTVAKIIGSLYQAMGILSENGPFKIAYREDFVAGYLGQTAIKTKALLSSCIGGVLFVDEVYSLGPGETNKDSFSKECIETITAFLSEHKNDFCFIGAGYEDDIKRCFFSANKGLERRFQWIHRIEKYNEYDLADIMIKMIKEMEWHISLKREEIIQIIKKDMKIFNNAGNIENFISKCKMVHAKRVFCLDPEHMFVFTKKDIENSIDLMKKYGIKTEEIKDNKHMSMYM
jgi:Holliday junction resolvasome RuvABC ATP-dependent DNA helicase subunit